MKAARKRFRRGSKCQASNIELSVENVAAIKLLDAWLSTPDVERDEWQEHLERLVEENRL